MLCLLLIQFHRQLKVLKITSLLMRNYRKIGALGRIVSSFGGLNVLNVESNENDLHFHCSLTTNDER